ARRPSARDLAGAISERVPSARLPRNRAVAPPASLLHPPRQRSRWRGAPRLALAAVGVLLVGALAAGALLVVPRVALPGGAKASGGEEAPAGADPAGSYAVDFDGVLTVDGARYHVGQGGDAVAVGDWGCTGRPTPVVLRPSTGELFTFDEWAQPGRDVTARPLGRVEHATSVRASRAGVGCHQLEVVRSQGPPARVEVAP
nr:hypothetical protein [Actinomycetota bacterium]